MIVRTTFREHKFSRTAKYHCICGRKFQRTAKEYWTENPFHDWQGREEELAAKCQRKMAKTLAKQECPGCGELVQPLDPKGKGAKR